MTAALLKRWATANITPRPPLPNANTGIIFDLLFEIWLEVLSHFHSVRVPPLVIKDPPLLPTITLERLLALRWHKHIADALEKRSNGLRNSPEQAKFV
ncbi:hypothetical protein C0991_009722, partial [Blastosporella zonata]